MLDFQVCWTPRKKKKKHQKTGSCVPGAGSGRGTWVCPVAKMMNTAKVTAILSLCCRKSLESFLADIYVIF